MAATPATAQEPAARLAVPEDYALVWADEFDGNGLPSEDRWTYDTARNREGWYNNEAQYYARRRLENARVENGHLVIEARHEDLSRDRFRGQFRDWGRQHYTSARLTTRGKRRWHTGFFEVRAKLPCVRGTWPAVWLLPDTHRGRWRSGEIDIVEAVGHEVGRVFHSVHTSEANFRLGNQERAETQMDACAQFHLYQLHWTPERVTIGVDGVPALVTSAEPFDRPMSLILNVAVGGDWGGAMGIDDSAFPARMEVDYVRIYQKVGR